MTYYQNIKDNSFRYLKITLTGLIPIPFVVIALYLFNAPQDVILIVSFLCSVIMIEYLHFSNFYTAALSNRNHQYAATTSTCEVFDIKHTDIFTFGAIIAKVNNTSDLLSSQEVTKEAAEVYSWAGATK